MISYDDLNHRHRHRPRPAGYSSAPAPSPLSRRAPAPAPGLPQDPDRSRSARDLTATRRGRKRVLANPMRTYLQFYQKWLAIHHQETWGTYLFFSLRGFLTWQTESRWRKSRCEVRSMAPEISSSWP